MYRKPITIVAILVYLAVCGKCIPLTGSDATIPRTDVLEAAIPNSGTPTNKTSSTVRSNGTNICMTKGCIKASALILDLIDESINPCDNFYEFACGKFLRNTFIPDDKIAMMSFVQVQEQVLGQLRSILNERSMPNESKPFTLTKTFNTACMDEITLEMKGIQPMVDILENYGGWPVVKGNNWKEDQFEWLDANRNISNDGLDDSLLFALAVLTDQKNSSRHSNRITIRIAKLLIKLYFLFVLLTLLFVKILFGLLT